MMHSVASLLVYLTCSAIGGVVTLGAWAQDVDGTPPDAVQAAVEVPVVAEHRVPSEARANVEAEVRAPTSGSDSQMPELFSAAYLFQVLGSLLVVFFCLFGVILLLRRFNRLGPSGAGPLRVVASASLGQRERVVLLEAGSEQLLVGVAPGSVRALHVLKEPLALDAGSRGSDFAEVLRAASPLGGRS